MATVLASFMKRLSTRHWLLAAIRFYQRRLSPHKGFGCAYRKHTGRASCSGLGYRAIRRHGSWAGIGILRQRMRRCGATHRRFQAPRSPLHAQRGFCDASCDLPGCDLPGCNVLDGCCLFDSASDCSGCDWPFDRRRKPAKKEDRPVPKIRSRVEPRSRTPTRDADGPPTIPHDPGP